MSIQNDKIRMTISVKLKLIEAPYLPNKNIKKVSLF